jgi:DNA-binding transcriptional regulator YdaS (Cro superfamily)
LFANVIETEPTATQRTLARAIKLAGGQEALAALLGCTLADIGRWYSTATIPEKAFIATGAIVEAKLAALRRRVYDDLEQVRATAAASRAVREAAREAVIESRLARVMLAKST